LHDELGAEQASAAREALARADALLLDWDGCVAFGNVPQPAAIALIAAYPGRVAIVSNNSTLLPADLSRILADASVDVPPHHVLLAGHEALAQAKRSGARRTLVLGDSRMKAHARNIGLELVQTCADAVVLLRDTRFSYCRLQRAVNTVAAGARLIVANPDLTHPGAGGSLIPETGALLAALLACVPAAKIEMIGKPAPGLYASACRRLGIAPERAVMIGDNPQTDMAGAAAAGISGILIGPDAGLGMEQLARLVAAHGTIRSRRLRSA
jgi:4-nitrophenyl phosphatase